MALKMLLPNGFKKIGWLLLIPSTIIGFIMMLSPNNDFLDIHATVFALYDDMVLSQNKHTGLINTSITNTLVGVLFILGGIMVGFSKEKKEDEFIANLRLSSLMWAVWANYILLLLSFLLIYGMGFFQVMIYNMFTVLIIFIGRFNFLLFKSKMTATYEK